MVFEIFRLIRQLRKRDEWDITDTIVKAEDLVYNQSLEFGGKYNTQGSFVCIRNFHFSCIYIKEEEFETFKLNRYVYNKKKKLINLTRIFRYMVEDECIAQVMNRTVPPSVHIKELKVCKVGEVTVYITRVIKLRENDQLFKDLINLQIFKDRYQLNQKGGELS